MTRTTKNGLGYELEIVEIAGKVLKLQAGGVYHHIEFERQIRHDNTLYNALLNGNLEILEEEELKEIDNYMHRQYLKEQCYNLIDSGKSFKVDVGDVFVTEVI